MLSGISIIVFSICNINNVAFTLVHESISFSATFVFVNFTTIIIIVANNTDR